MPSDWPAPAEDKGMSETIRPTLGASQAGAAYSRAVLEVLGDSDPFAVQEVLFRAVCEAIAGLSDAQLRTPEAPGKWSIAQVIEHLVDAELIHNYRVRMILTHDTPDLPGYDQDAFAERLGYDRCDVDRSLMDLEMLRNRNLRLLRSLSGQERARAGIHSSRGRESIEDMIKLIAGHDLVHRRQIERIKSTL